MFARIRAKAPWASWSITRRRTSNFPICWCSLKSSRRSSASSCRYAAEDVKVLKGGPVETGRGFVLHSADFFIENSTLPIDEGICLTATLDILKAIARGNGPESAILALGYAGWAPGQLEHEIQENGWLHCAADPELIFGTDTDLKYDMALRKIGVDLGQLSSDSGHA